jgi:polysaccharide biosynthesis/export protein
MSCQKTDEEKAGMKSWKKSTITLSIILVLACLHGLAQDEQKEASAATTNTSAATTPKVNSSDSSPAFQQRHPRYKLEAGDTFDILFELSPEFNQSAVAVQPDGFVTLRGIGDLHVAGETVPDLIESLRTAYGQILHDPIISVTLKEFDKPYFIADGQLGKPGKYDLRGEVTLTEAVAIAGGFTDAAKHSQVLLFRRVNDQWTSAQIFNLKKMEKKGDLHEDPVLHPGDMLFVPKNAYSKIRTFIPNASVGTFVNPTSF